MSLFFFHPSTPYLDANGITVNTASVHFVEGIFGVTGVFEFHESITVIKVKEESVHMIHNFMASSLTVSMNSFWEQGYHI
jgi:hypothetical protein